MARIRFLSPDASAVSVYATFIVPRFGFSGSLPWLSYAGFSGFPLGGATMYLLYLIAIGVFGGLIAAMIAGCDKLRRTSGGRS
ncbi:putative membrane protein [Burkholderia sp. ABCPW 111]|nr:putative membrane protein [Burkholderia sp. ABCPW 111]